MVNGDKLVAVHLSEQISVKKLVMSLTHNRQPSLEEVKTGSKFGDR